MIYRPYGTFILVNFISNYQYLTPNVVVIVEMSFLKLEELHFLIKKQTYKPDSVSKKRSLIIYLGLTLLQASSYLPFNNGREALKC